MKLSITNAGLAARVGYKESLKLIKDAGFDAVDYDLSARAEDHQLGDGYIEAAKEMRTYMDGIGLECAQTHGPFPVMYNKPFDETYSQFVKILRAIEFTAILGAPIIVIHSIEMPKEYFGETFDYNYNFYKRLEPYAKEFGVKIAIENLYIEDEKRHHYHAPGRFSTPDIMDKFLGALDSDVFCVCLDTGHAALCGLEPWMFVDNLEHKEAIAAIHVHDVDYASDTHTIPYNISRSIKGIDWEKTMHSLYEAGYAGYLNFETNAFHLCFPDELIPHALAFAAKVGKHLVSLLK